MLKMTIPLLATSLLGMATIAASAGECGDKSITPTILEVVTFKLADGITDEAFLSSSSEMEKAFLCSAQGFVSRTLSKDKEGNWIDSVQWSNLKDAQGAAEKAMKVEEAAPFMQAIDFNSVQLKHWTIMKRLN